MRYYVNYKQYNDSGKFWWDTWHRGLKTERGTCDWLKRNSFEPTDTPSVWHGTKGEYRDMFATVHIWEELPESVQKLMLDTNCGPNS